jgi:hypothetical protein
MDIERLAAICYRYKYICGVNPRAEVVVIEPGALFPLKEHVLCRYGELEGVSELEAEMFIIGLIFT